MIYQLQLTTIKMTTHLLKDGFDKYSCFGIVKDYGGHGFDQYHKYYNLPKSSLIREVIPVVSVQPQQVLGQQVSAPNEEKMEAKDELIDGGKVKMVDEMPTMSKKGSYGVHKTPAKKGGKVKKAKYDADLFEYVL
jgi:hypothetical protein